MTVVHEIHDIAGPDGNRLRIEVFRPDVDQPVGAAFHATPYGAHLLRDDAARHAEAGYAVVSQDVRGRFGSDGDFDLGASAGRDGAATVAWICEQPWSDGRVVGRGASFGGVTQLAVAVEAPDAFDSIAPVMAPDPWVGLSFRSRGGPIRIALLAHWLIRQAASDPAADPAASHALLLAAFEHFQVLSAMDGFAAVNPGLAAAHPAVGRLPLSPPAELDTLPVWRDLWDRAFDPPTAPPSSPTPITTPTLVTVGWYDLFVGDAIGVFASAEHPDSRLLLVPSGHGFHLLQHPVPPEGHRYGLDVDHRWACERLLGADEGLGAGPRVTYWCFGVDEWRTSSTWPPAGAQSAALPLSAGATRDDGGLGAPGGDTAATVALHSDPRRPYPTPGGASLGFPPGPVPLVGVGATDRPDVASFRSQPGVGTLAGPVDLRIWVSAPVADFDVTAVLVIEGADGVARSILTGTTRLRHQHPGVDLTAPVPVDVALGPIAWALAADERLRLDVTTSDFPRYDRNLQTGGPEAAEPLSAAVAVDVTIHTDQHASVLTITVLAEEPTQ